MTFNPEKNYFSAAAFLLKLRWLEKEANNETYKNYLSEGLPLPERKETPDASR